ncbi:MAG TPA: N-formylglutamate amidohydrolase [Rhizomicrobium sp.]|jgi:N-formylglutamate deformylase|nr:N-formylglutamate amidohydrolase [Rhizomicrobium sp.]
MADSQRNSAAGRAFDGALAALFAHPFKIYRPEQARIPFVFASPHSGRLYPESFTAQSRLDALCLRRSEDAYADMLFAGAAELGAPMIAARFPRAYVDANRAPSELDPAMFEGSLALSVDQPNARVNAGLGVIPRIVRDGAEIYRGKLDPREAERRLARLHAPYHAALARLIDETLARFGVAILIDCHTMPSAAAAPQVVVGDRFGQAAAPMLSDLAERCFSKAGFSVGRNAPYAGGYTTHLYGRRERYVHALQIEIDRSLYLDEERIALKPEFEPLRRRLDEALARLTAVDVEALGRARPQAAE